MNRLKRNIDIILILLLGFILRFSVSITHSYSNDELSAINRLQYDNFSDLIELGVKTGDMHPAGVQVFMKAWASIGGLSESFMRFPFVVCGVLSIMLVFLLGNRWINRNTGLVAAAILCTLYFPIMNSEFARPYSPGLLFSLLVGWFYLKLLFEPGSKPYRNAIFLGLCYAGAMYSHYFAFMFVGWVGLSGVFFLNASNWKPYLLSGIIAIVSYLPHLAVTQFQLGVGGLQWLAPPDADWLFQFIFHAFNSSWWVVISLLGFIFLSFFIKSESALKLNPQLIMFILWFFGIYIIGHVYSIVSTPVLKYPVMLFAFPFLLLIIAGVISQFKYVRFLVPSIILGIGCSTIIEKDLYGNLHYELFEEIAVDIVDWEDEYGEDNIYTVYNINNPNYMNFYANQWGRTIEFDWDVIEYGESAQIREDLLITDKEYCIVGYSARLTLPQVFETCKEFYPYIIDGTKYNNSAVYLLSKKPSHQIAQETQNLSLFLPNQSTENWDFDKKKIVPDTSESGIIYGHYDLDKENPYGPTYRFSTDEIDNHSEKYMSVFVNGVVPAEGQLTVSLSAERDGEVLMHRDEPYWLGWDLEVMMVDNNSGYFAFSIPEFIREKDVLKISLWNRNPEVSIQIYQLSIDVVENIWN